MDAQPSAADEVARLRGRVLELECELADVQGKPRPGENVRMEVGSVGGREGVSVFAQDRRTGILVSGSGANALQARRHALSLLRDATSPAGAKRRWTDRTSSHCAICPCAVCGESGLSDEDDQAEDEAPASSRDTFKEFWSAATRFEAAQTLMRTAQTSLEHAAGRFLPETVHALMDVHPQLERVSWTETTGGLTLTEVRWDGDQLIGAENVDLHKRKVLDKLEHLAGKLRFAPDTTTVLTEAGGDVTFTREGVVLG